MLIDWLKGTVVATLPLLAGPISLGAQQAARSDSTPPDTLHPYALAPVVVTASRVPASRQGRLGEPQFELLAEGGGATERGAQAHSEITVAGGAGRLRYSSGVSFAYNRGIYALPNDLLTSDASVRLDAAPAERWTLTATAR